MRRCRYLITDEILKICELPLRPVFYQFAVLQIDNTSGVISPVFKTFQVFKENRQHFLRVAITNSSSHIIIFFFCYLGDAFR
ncbi:hypothetical protein SAMN02745220_04561 [Desulfopila aestuarii DSM 18488]|uniref:Uncharacterized protein n=1 Tax=Desulfopila aestuarii DSM 18488 TaxID=1121416 RepID=A0A1M7YIJ0_9BACT|nr:hypothetical protein SAMN02745220_04561 [Desulfopila aestuarii DSM 18488]